LQSNFLFRSHALFNRFFRIQQTSPDSITTGMAHLRYRKSSSFLSLSSLTHRSEALLTYATTLAFYFHLRASEKYAQRPELLQSHPILFRLLTLKQSLSTLVDLDFSFSDDSDDSEDEVSLEDTDDCDVSIQNEQLWRHAKRKGLEDNELADLLQDAGLEDQTPLPRLRSGVEDSPRPQKKHKSISQPSKPAVPAFDLEEPVFQSSKSRPSVQDTSQADVFGEMTSLRPADAADKQARKKSLRFHTWKIESASARRQGARANAMGGDDDIPYRGRKKESRVTKDKGMGGEDLDDVEPLSRNLNMVGNGDDGDEYYEYIKKQTKERKEGKKAEYDDARAAERYGVLFKLHFHDKPHTSHT
jgi:U3 small nucleolar RNA-associated protein 3